jgi:G6PDH family F420-dependent oxidoreductase
LGVGTGEALNEHILGDHWPAYEMRADMLVEAIQVIRLLWEGGSQTFYGDYYTVENARIYTLPDELPPIMVAASGKTAATMAGEVGDGLISTAPDADIVAAFEEGGRRKRPRYGQMTVCCGENKAEAKRIAHLYWPNAALHGELSQVLPTPAHFEQAARGVTEEEIAKSILCGNDVDQHKAQIEEYAKAGFDYVYVHQIGPDQEAFFKFYEKEILPAYR